MSYRDGVEKRGTRRYPKGQGPNKGKRGRLTRVPGEVSIVRLRVVVTAREMGELQQVASDNRVTVSEVVREAVNEYVADYRDRKLFSKTRGAARAALKEQVCDGYR